MDEEPWALFRLSGRLGFSVRPIINLFVDVGDSISGRQKVRVASAIFPAG